LRRETPDPDARLTPWEEALRPSHAGPAGGVLFWNRRRRQLARNLLFKAVERELTPNLD